MIIPQKRKGGGEMANQLDVWQWEIMIHWWLITFLIYQLSIFETQPDNQMENSRTQIKGGIVGQSELKKRLKRERGYDQRWLVQVEDCL